MVSIGLIIGIATILVFLFQFSGIDTTKKAIDQGKILKNDTLKILGKTKSELQKISKGNDRPVEDA